MTSDHSLSLERFLTKFESQTDNLFKLSESVTKTMKSLRTCAKEGNLRDFARSLDSFQRAFATFKQEVENSENSWHFDHETYFSSKAFHEELRRTAESVGLTIHERDDRLYFYPAIITINPKEPSVRIDRKTEKRLRPSRLVKYLAELTKTPHRTKPEEFLESIFAAYMRVARLTESQLSTPGPVVPLLEIYDLLTLLPGLPNEYTLQEFARDIYVIDRNRVRKTKKGYPLDFSASTALRSTRGIISTITPEGEEKRYYGLRFMPKDTGGTNQ